MDCKCTCHSECISHMQVDGEKVEQLIEKTLFGCLQTWLFFWLRKLLSCIEREKCCYPKNETEEMASNSDSLHTPQAGSSKIHKE